MRFEIENLPLTRLAEARLKAAVSVVVARFRANDLTKVLDASWSEPVQPLCAKECQYLRKGWEPIFSGRLRRRKKAFNEAMQVFDRELQAAYQREEQARQAEAKAR